MSALRPLPPRPSLEFERKEAKALLRRLRAGEPEALARACARHSALDASAPDRIRLADAQLVIAREYGFTSWPRLVRYFGEVDRQSYTNRTVHGARREDHDAWVRTLLAEHRDRRVWVARQLAAYVPRFYGMRIEDVFAAAVTEDDARLAYARSEGFPSWEVILEEAATIAADMRRHDTPWEHDPMRYAAQAMEAGDLAELQRVIEKHPDLLAPSEYEWAKGRNLLGIAIHHERRKGVEAMRPIIQWLEAQGLDYRLELNRQLCGHMRMTTAKVQWLLDRGADASWVAPNGIPVLEHALIRYWNGEAASLVAARTVPRDALWIAAGLGDVDGVRRFLDRDGRPKLAARRLRPDFDAVGPAPVASHPDPEDEEVLMEAFLIAMLNSRTRVMEYLVSRGLDINSMVWGSPAIHMAIGNAMTSVLESMLRCGASLDLRGWRPASTGRELARELFESMPQDAERRRIVELCGMDPDAILDELKSRPVDPPRLAPDLQTALELAGDDAFRLGQTEIGPENLLFGLLRFGKLPAMYFTKVSRMDLERFRVDVADRIRPGEERVERPKLLLNADAQVTVQAAIAAATEERRDRVGTLHLLYALLIPDKGVAAQLLARYGASGEALLERMKGSC